MVVILSPLTTAQNETDLNYLSDLDVKVSIHSKLNIDYLNPDSKLKNMNTTLHFFPKDTDFQTLTTSNLFTTPTAEITQGDMSTEFIWKNPTEDELTYNYDAELNSKLALRKVKQKISFPLKETLPEYTIPTTFILSNSQQVKNQASSIAEGQDDLYEVVFDIAVWVNENINYSLETLTADLVQNADWVLENRKGVCDELTVLFISMLRSIGIPARFVSGSSYTNLINGFGNHAWAEVYFPGTGWVPFDPTYGQMGFVDATHIKMRDSLYAKESAVNYVWLSKDIEVSADKLDIEADVKTSGSRLQPLVNMNIVPLNTRVRSGSTVPIQIELENPQDFYLPITLYLTKAPKSVDDNSRQILLRPFEKKNIFWDIELPTDTKSGYTYTTTIEFIDFFGSSGSAEVEYGDSFDLYSKQQAEAKISQLSEAEEKTYNDDVNIKCTGKDVYYLYEQQGQIDCIIKNIGNTNLEDLNICLDTNCKKVALQIQDEIKLDFQFDLELGSKESAVKVENNNILKYDYIPIKVLEEPKIIIEDLQHPETIDYKSKGKIQFTLQTDAPVENVVINVKDNPVFQLDDLQAGSKFNIPFKGSLFYKDDVKIEITYKDQNGNTYNTEETIKIQVTNPPWYAGILGWINNIF